MSFFCFFLLLLSPAFLYIPVHRAHLSRTFPTWLRHFQFNFIRFTHAVWEIHKHAFTSKYINIRTSMFFTNSPSFHLFSISISLSPPMSFSFAQFFQTSFVLLFVCILKISCSLARSLIPSLLVCVLSPASFMLKIEEIKMPCSLGNFSFELAAQNLFKVWHHQLTINSYIAIESSKSAC